jgi:hypothetical protein
MGDRSGWFSVEVFVQRLSNPKSKGRRTQAENSAGLFQVETIKFRDGSQTMVVTFKSDAYDEKGWYQDPYGTDIKVQLNVDLVQELHAFAVGKGLIGELSKVGSPPMK